MVQKGLTLFSQQLLLLVAVNQLQMVMVKMVDLEAVLVHLQKVVDQVIRADFHQ